MNFLNTCRIGRIIPMIVTMAFLLDVAARFIPLDWLSFRAWEALRRYHAPCGPFRADAHYENALSYGDLASMGNMPQYRQYRQEIFSTDRFGFRRNSNRMASASKYGALLMGDSMAVGSGVNDNETLAAELEQHLGTGVYNGAGSDLDPKGLDQILSLARRLKLTKGTVLYEYLERYELPHPEELLGDSDSENTDSSCQHWKTRWSIWYDGFTEVSGLQIIAQRAFKKLENDSILPNIFKFNVVIRTLKKGEPILFYPDDVAIFRLERSVDVSGFKGLAAELGKRNLRLVVILVPTKYTVYQPLLEGADLKKGDSTLYLDVVEKSLKEAHIPVINLANLFREKAQEYYQQNLYIYWQDDIHWNARGIKLAAEEILKEKLIQ